jgi:hypothetical protein
MNSSGREGNSNHRLSIVDKFDQICLNDHTPPTFDAWYDPRTWGQSDSSAHETHAAETHAAETHAAETSATGTTAAETSALEISEIATDPVIQQLAIGEEIIENQLENEGLQLEHLAEQNQDMMGCLKQVADVVEGWITDPKVKEPLQNIIKATGDSGKYLKESVEKTTEAVKDAASGLFHGLMSFVAPSPTPPADSKSTQSNLMLLKKISAQLASCKHELNSHDVLKMVDFAACMVSHHKYGQNPTYIGESTALSRNVDAVCRTLSQWDATSWHGFGQVYDMLGKSLFSVWTDDNKHAAISTLQKIHISHLNHKIRGVHIQMATHVKNLSNRSRTHANQKCGIYGTRITGRKHSIGMMGDGSRVPDSLPVYAPPSAHNSQQQSTTIHADNSSHALIKLQQYTTNKFQVMQKMFELFQREIYSLQGICRVQKEQIKSTHTSMPTTDNADSRIRELENDLQDLSMQITTLLHHSSNDTLNDAQGHIPMTNHSHGTPNPNDKIKEYFENPIYFKNMQIQDYQILLNTLNAHLCGWIFNGMIPTTSYDPHQATPELARLINQLNRYDFSEIETFIAMYNYVLSHLMRQDSFGHTDIRSTIRNAHLTLLQHKIQHM